MNNRGDTLVEVLLVISLMAIVVLSIFGIMGRGMSQLQLAVERSQVRTELDGQARALQWMRDSYSADPSSTGGQLWSYVLANHRDTADPVFDGGSCNRVSSLAFYVNIDVPTSSITIEPYDNTMSDNNPSYAKPGRGMWIEMFDRGTTTPPPPGPTPPKAVDILMRACWQAIGQPGLQHETSLVRLYDGQ